MPKRKKMRLFEEDDEIRESLLGADNKDKDEDEDLQSDTENRTFLEDTDTVRAMKKRDVLNPIEKSGSLLNALEQPTKEQEIFQLEPREFTDIIGGNGCWQIKILILTMLPSLPFAWNTLGMSFIAYPVDHWCERQLNVSVETWWNEYLPNTTIKGELHHSQCEMFVLNENLKVFNTSRTISCSSYEYASDFNSIVNQWDIVCDTAWMISTGQTVYMAGFLIAVFLSGQFSDMYGRHPTIMINTVIYIIAGFSVAFSTSFFMFTISRFFVALGQAGVGLIIYTLLIEALGSEHRVLYAILQAVGWITGIITLPLIAVLTKDWFTIQIIITAPSVIFLSYYWLLEESPRWLLANGMKEKALPILENAAKMNGKRVTDLSAKVDIVLTELNIEKKQTTKTTMIDLLRTPNLRMKTLCLYFIWPSIAFTYYGLSLNTNDLGGNQYLNFFFSGLVEIPAHLYVLLTLNRFGRKKPFFLALMLGGISCFACIFIPNRFTHVKTALAMIGKMFNTSSFSTVYIFSAELFPTVARNTGIGSCSTIARIGSALSPLMKDLGSVTNPSVPLFLFGVVSILSALLLLKLPETNNCPVPESIDQAENFGLELTKEIGTKNRKQKVENPL